MCPFVVLCAAVGCVFIWVPVDVLSLLRCRVLDKYPAVALDLCWLCAVLRSEYHNGRWLIRASGEVLLFPNIRPISLTTGGHSTSK